MVASYTAIFMIYSYNMQEEYGKDGNKTPIGIFIATWSLIVVSD